MSQIKALFNLAPAEAVALMQQRAEVRVTYDADEMMREAHAQQFTVSRLTRVDILSAMQKSLEKSVAGDLSRRDWTRDTRQLLQDAGLWGLVEVETPDGRLVTTRFDNARLKLIFDTNTRIAYAAGQWERAWNTRKAFPYLRYIHTTPVNAREQHKRWHNLVLPIEHVFWRTHYPPNGWNCKCRALPMSRAEYDRGLSPTGEKLDKTAPELKVRDYVNRSTGEVERVPEGVDPGFAYNPGIAKMDKLQKLTKDKLEAALPEIAQTALRPREVVPISPAFRETVDKTLGQIPEAVRVEVLGAGIEVQLAPRLTDAVPRLQGVKPRGFEDGTSWDHTDGVFLPRERVLVVSETAQDAETGQWLGFNAPRAAATVRHEVGHAFDFVRELSASAAFMAAYEQDAAALRPWLDRHDIVNEDQKEALQYLLQAGKAGPHETFAEVFAALVGGAGMADLLNVVEAFPSVAKLIRKLLDTMK